MSKTIIFGYYHRVQPSQADAASRALAVAPQSLRRHIEALKAGGYALMTASQAAASSPQRAAALTFDDGFADNHELALPMMQDLGVPGTVFVIASTLASSRLGSRAAAPGASENAEGSSAVHDAGLYLSRDQVRSLHAAGWEIGSHAFDHCKLPQLGEADQRRQLLDSRLLLEDVIGARVRSVAYPFGMFDEITLRAAEAAGYDHGFTTAARGGGRGRYDIPRLSLGGYGLRALKQRLKLALAMRRR